MSNRITLPECISASPRVYVADGFVTAAETAAVLSRYDGAAAAGVDWSSGIAGMSCELAISADPLLADIAARVEAVLGFGCTLGDSTFRFRRYAIGDFHPPHVDCYEIDGMHLVATALVYLTDATAGGETMFPDAERGPLAISARAGRLALWFNYTPDGEIDSASMHQSEALVAGEKATIAYFIYAPLACTSMMPRATERALQPA